MNAAETVEIEYSKRIDAMTIAQRVQRAMEMLVWARGFVARQVHAERGSLPVERLKWEVALRQYGADPMTRSLIEEMLSRVSG